MQLKVGDIEMNSAEGVALAHPGQTRADGASAGGDATAFASSHEPLLRYLPDWPSRSYRALAAASAAVAVAVVLVSALVPLSLLSMVAIVATIPSLAGIAVASAVVARRRSVLEEAPDIPDEVLQLRASQIVAALGAADRPVSVEWLMESLTWTESAVVTGLRHLVEEDRVREELDIETGQWTYEYVTRADELASRQALPVAAREQALLEKP